MGSRTRRSILPLAVVLLLLGSPFAAAQQGAGGDPSPDRLWSYDTGQASVNDVAITADGTVGAAVLSDASGSNQNDGEICPWRLTKNPQSSDTAWSSCADPSEGLLLAPEGMGVVSVHPKPNGNDVFIAVGNEGTSGDSQSNIYVYSLGAGPGSGTEVTYPGDDSGPTTPLQDLFFLNAKNLVAWHEDRISLLRHDEGQAFQGSDRWSPGSGSIANVDVSEDGSRILVTVQDGSDIQLYILERDGGDLVRVTNAASLNDRGSSEAAGLDADGDHAVVGTGDGWVYYYQIVPENQTDDDDRGFNFSASPYTDQGDSAVTALDVGPDGELFVVGFNDGITTLFEQTVVETDGPRAASTGSFDGPRGPSQVQFAQGAEQLYVTAGSLHAFHARQFQDGGDLDPIWVVTPIGQAEFSGDGQRFMAQRQNTVLAFQQSYEAQITIDGAQQIAPGHTGEWTVEIANTGSTFDRYTLGTDGAPNSWTTQFNRSSVELLPGESANVTLNVTPDATQAPTNETITVEATSSAAPGGGVVGSADKDVTVPVLRGATISVQNDRIEARQGNPVEIRADVLNTGNTETTITLEVDQEAGWDVQIAGQTGTNADLELTARENASVPISLTVPSDAAEGSSNEVTLTVQPKAGGTEDSASVTVLVEPSFGGTISGPTEELEATPGEETTFQVSLQNTGNTVDSFRLTSFSNASNPDHLWRVTLSETTVEVPADGSQTIDVTVNVPRGAEVDETTDVTINARSTTTDEKVDEATFTLRVPEETDDSPLPLVVVPVALGLAALARRRQT